MTRRDYLRRASCALLGLPLLRLPEPLPGKCMGIVVHSYILRWQSTVPSDKFPGFKNAMELLEHCHAIGAGGLQVTVRDWATDFSRRVRDRREQFEMFLEGSIALPRDRGDADRFLADMRAAKEAGMSVVRTVCLSGRRYEKFSSAEDFEKFKESSLASLTIAEPIARKLRVRLAIENHKDWRAPELVHLMKQLDSEWIGVNLDFGNNIALIEDPMEVVESLAPYTLTTHVKDMAVKEYEHGFLLSEVPLGQGILDLKKMMEHCAKYRAGVNFNLEMITRDPLKIPCYLDAFWGTMANTKASQLARTLRLVRANEFNGDLPAVSHLTDAQRLEAEEENVLASLAYSGKHLLTH